MLDPDSASDAGDDRNQAQAAPAPRSDRRGEDHDASEMVQLAEWQAIRSRLCDIIQTSIENGLWTKR